MLTHGTYTCYTQTHTHAQTRTNTYTHTRARATCVYTYPPAFCHSCCYIHHTLSVCCFQTNTHTHTEVLWTLTSNWTIVEERAGLLKWPGSTQSFSFSLNIFVLFCFFFFFFYFLFFSSSFLFFSLLEIRGFFSGSVGRQTGRKLCKLLALAWSLAHCIWNFSIHFSRVLPTDDTCRRPIPWFEHAEGSGGRGRGCKQRERLVSSLFSRATLQNSPHINTKNSAFSFLSIRGRNFSGTLIQQAAGS